MAPYSTAARWLDRLGCIAAEHREHTLNLNRIVPLGTTEIRTLAIGSSTRFARNRECSTEHRKQRCPKRRRYQDNRVLRLAVDRNRTGRTFWRATLWKRRGGASWPRPRRNSYLGIAGLRGQRARTRGTHLRRPDFFLYFLSRECSDSRRLEWGRSFFRICPNLFSLLPGSFRNFGHRCSSSILVFPFFLYHIAIPKQSNGVEKGKSRPFRHSVAGMVLFYRAARLRQDQVAPFRDKYPIIVARFEGFKVAEIRLTRVIHLPATCSQPPYR